MCYGIHYPMYNLIPQSIATLYHSICRELIISPPSLSKCWSSDQLTSNASESINTSMEYQPTCFVHIMPDL